MSDDEDDVCLHKGVRVPNGPYLTTSFGPKTRELLNMVDYNRYLRTVYYR